MKALLAHLGLRRILVPALAVLLLLGTAMVNTVAGDTALANTADSQPGGGGHNVVHVVNLTDGRLRVAGRVQLNRIPGPNVGAVNEAYSYASCNQCQTFAVALQINLVRTGVSSFHPKNLAIALNYHCTGCLTVARALQYNISVPDPSRPPAEALALVHALNRVLDTVRGQRAGSVSTAVSRINAVVTAFQVYANALTIRHARATSPTSPNAKPVTTSTPTVTPTDTVTPAPTGSPTVTLTSSPEPTSTATDTPTATATPTAIPTATTVALELGS